MYAPPSTAATAARRGIWSLAAICCLGLLGLLIVSTIILALIPIYLPSKSVSISTVPNNTFYLQYATNGDANSNLAGTASNTGAISQALNQALGTGNALTVQQANVQTTYARQRRSFFGFGREEKRAIKINFLFACQANIDSSCVSPKCRTDLVTRIQKAAQNVQTISNIPFTVQSKQFGTTVVSYSFTFVGLLTTRPAGFAGEPTTLGQFVAINSGDFGDATTWQNGIIPYGAASITVAAGVSLTISTSAMELNIQRMDIYGTLALGSSSTSTFTFQQSTNLLVYNGGKLQDQTSSGKIYTRTNSVLRVHPGGSCGGSANTQIVSFTSLPETSSSGTTLTLGSSVSGPFTCGVISSSSIQSFQKVTYIASQSGDFTANNTWLGGILPTADVCSLVGGCGMYIAQGCTLSTASLNNQLSINFNVIAVASGATIQLGTSGVSGGFTFNFATAITVQSGGRCQDQTSNNQLYTAAGSVFTFYSGATFVGTNTVIQTYTSLPAASNLGTASSKIGSSISGALTVAVISTTSVVSFPKVTFIATASSGSIIAGSTYLGGTAPTADLCTSIGGCGVYVAPSCSLTTAGISNQLNININTITVSNGGTFVLGTTDVSGGFTFNFATALTVQSGGKCQHQTTSNQIYCTANSVFTFYSGATFVGTNSVIQTYTSLPAASNLGTASSKIGSSISGALTVAVLSTSNVQSFNKVTCIATASSGSIIAGSTYLGGTAPTADLCTSIGGCGVYVAPSCSLTTAGISNQLNININTITVSNGGTFVLGTTDVSGGFTFNFATALTVQSGGKCQHQTTSNQIYCTANSVFTFYAGATFVGTNSVIQTYTSLPAASNLGTASSVIGSSISGALTVAVLSTSNVQSFPRVTFIATASSGSIIAGSTYLGGTAPTADLCTSIGGCGVYVAPSCSLTTAGISNQLNININTITVSNGGTFVLGTTDVSGGFTFNFATALTVQSGGKCQHQTTSNQIYCTANSVFTFYSGATFVGTNSVIQTYTSLPAASNLGTASYTIGSSISGALTVGVISTTSIQTFPKVTCIATVSGSITAGSTYLGGIAPTTDLCTAAGGCGVYIASGCTLTTVGISNQLTININVITVANGGKCALGTTDVNTGFTFNFPVGFVVQTGGLIQDLTPLHQIYCAAGSAFTFYGGQAFTGVNTQIYTYTTLPATASLGTSYIFGSTVSGPFTFGILLDGTTQQFNSVTFIAATSGSFVTAGTWLGGVAPTADVCAAVGCGLYIASGCVLSTADLGGTLNINFNVITINTGATFQLGKLGVRGFKFAFAVAINNYGIMQDVSGNNGGIFIPEGSNFYLFGTGSFTCVVETSLFVYDLLSGLNVGTPIILETDMFGPYFITISITGFVSVSLEFPGLITTTQSIRFTTGFGVTGGLM